jgi:hypothetical protein
MSDAAVPIWFEPSQICNMIFAPANDRSNTGALSARSAGNHLTAAVLKPCAIAGAFSLLTLHRNLAQY